MCLTAFVQPAYAQEQSRTLHFPSGKPIGIIFVGNDKLVFGHIVKYRRIAGASGTMTIHVPSGQRVLFEANRRVFENPACLDLVSPQGLDVIKIGGISLDDKEDGMCDKALEHAVHFQGLQEMDIDRSEATDKGIAKLKAIPSLLCISCFMSSIDGSCFKELATLPALKALRVSHCTLDRKNLEYLKNFPKLQTLDVGRTHLDAVGTKSLALCKNLRELSVRGNQGFDDNCLSILCSLKNLKFLDLRETPVTLAGVKRLHALKLSQLQLPRALNDNLTELRKMFPQTMVWVDPLKTSAGPEKDESYAPLK
jgi:Leucine-rich repeat (LRR) protein